MGRFLQPDPAKGDPNTIGGYMAVHGRPAAFEGSDGLSYSVAIEVDRTGDAGRPWGAFFLFLRWRRIGHQGVESHLESDFLVWGASPSAVRESLGAMSLTDVRAVLESLIRAASPAPSRRWWDAMRDEDEEN